MRPQFLTRGTLNGLSTSLPKGLSNPEQTILTWLGGFIVSLVLDKDVVGLAVAKTSPKTWCTK